MDISHLVNHLSSAPTRFPDYCLALSSTFLNYMVTLLPQRPGFTLSVGSGSGLLEAIITHTDENVLVEGVEVNSTVNRYIAEENMHVVGGNWGLCSQAAHALAWMFVYPRDPNLITKYIQTYGDDAEMLIWIGPRVDWVDYESCFRQSIFADLLFPEDVGLTPYERVVVARKSLS